MKFLKPEEIIEPGYYWAKLTQDADPEPVRINKDMSVRDTYGYSLFAEPSDLSDYEEFYGPIKDPWAGLEWDDGLGGTKYAPHG